MDVEWGTLDYECERFRGEDAAEMISRRLCLGMTSYLLSEIDIL